MKIPICGLMILGSCLSSATDSHKIVIKGSDTLGAKMIPQLAKAYKAEGHDIVFEIAAEGSSTAFTSWIGEDSDIGMSSRGAKEKEIKAYTDKGLQLTSHVCAYDMIAVIVNSQNPVNSITRKQAEQIFTGKIRDWKAISSPSLDAPIIVFTRNTSSGTYKTFQKLAMNKKDYGKNCQKMAGGAQLHVEVAKTPSGISYVGLAYAASKGMKPLSIDNVAPLAKNVSSYPLSRKLFLLTTQKTHPKALHFVHWVITSPKAAKIIKKVGFVPVPQSLHGKSSKLLTPPPSPAPQ